MMRRKLAMSLVALAALAMVSAGTPRAGAQPADDVARARDLFREGSALAEAGKWDAARSRFERSLAYHRAALTLYNLGIAQQETGHLVDAIGSFRTFLAQPVEPSTQQYVEPVRGALIQLEGRVAQVEVAVQPADLPGLVLRIDDHEVRPAPGPRRMDPGRHEIVASAPGYCEVHQTTEVAEGGHASVALTLAPPPPAPTSAALPAALTVGGLALFVGGEVVFGVGVHEALATPLGAGATKTMVAGNVVGGVGAVALGAGIVLLVTRARPRAAKAAVAPWSSGNVAGVKVRF
jgi:hypothetical protein